MKKVYIVISLSILAASLASGQVVYDDVKIKVAPGVTCPSGWTASEETITTPTRYIVQAPAILGGRGFRVTLLFVNAVWPSAADKATATTTGLLVIQAGSTVEVHYCGLTP